MEDRRTVRSKKAIRQAFLALLKEKGLNHITVSELSRRADLGRGTFYLHYKDIYDLYDHIENELYTDLLQLFDSSGPSTDPHNLQKLTETVTAYIDENRELFQLIVGSGADGNALHRLRKMFTEKVLMEDPSFYLSEFDRVESLFIVSGVIGVLEEWLDNGLALPRHEISVMLHQVLLKF